PQPSTWPAAPRPSGPRAAIPAKASATVNTPLAPLGYPGVLGPRSRPTRAAAKIPTRPRTAADPGRPVAADSRGWFVPPAGRYPFGALRLHASGRRHAAGFGRRTGRLAVHSGPADRHRRPPHAAGAAGRGRRRGAAVPV